MATGNIARNDITGKFIKSAPPTQAYRDGWDNIFKSKKYFLATSSFCGPCKIIKEYIKSNNLTVEIKDMDEDPNFFSTHNIKSVPCLTITKGEDIVANITGQSNIMTFFQEEM
jgi:hypothetical protein